MPATLASLPAKAELLQILRSCNRDGFILKTASGLGGDPEETFEQAFASLAFSYVKDKAPRLLDFVKGFQLVDRNDDNTKAVGVFGFQLPGGKWLYAPVFFLNGDLKGHELLYVKDQDAFVPLDEGWVNYLVGRSPQHTGQPTHETVRSLGIMQPDIRNLSIPPFYSKYGAAALPWYQEFLPVLGYLATTPPEQLAKYAGLDERFNVPAFCSRHFWASQLMKNACDRYPEINRLCDKFYGRGWLKRALESLRDAATKETAEVTDSILGDTLDDEDARERREVMQEVINKDASFLLSGRELPAWRTKRAAEPPVEIKVLDDMTLTVNDDLLDDEERKRLFRDGYLIRDYRDGDEVSKVYNVQRKCELVNPDVTEIYDVLTKPGELVELLIVAEPHTSRGRQDFATVVRTDGKKNWLNAHRTTLWVLPQRRSRGEVREWFDGFEGADPASLEEGAKYIVIGRNTHGTLEGSAPFEVRRSLGEQRYQVYWYDHTDRGRPTVLKSVNHRRTYSMGEYDRDRELHGSGDLLFFSDRQGVRFKSVQGTLMVPRTHKVLRLSSPKEIKDEHSCCCVSPWQSEEPAIEPGDWGDIQLQIIQKTAELKLYSDGSEASINAGPLQSKKAALLELMRDYGLREAQARELIKDAEQLRLRGRPALFRVKYAQGYPMLGPGPTAPAIPEAEYGYDDLYGGYPTQYPQVDFREVPELAASLTDPDVYNPLPEAMPDPMAMQSAQQAGQMGQKEVFDTAMLSGLLKNVRQDSAVDRHTGDLVKAVDRVGRLLFTFHWANDEFSERYGKRSLPELEDSLRNTFESLGDLVLFLRQKDVSPLMGGVISEPSVDDTPD